MGKQVTRQDAVEMIDQAFAEWTDMDPSAKYAGNYALTVAIDAQKKANLALEIMRALLTEEK